jgi:hypothetical protein
MTYLSPRGRKYRGSKNKKSGSKSGASSFAKKGKRYLRGSKR